MVGICSLLLSVADSFRFGDAAASGIGRCLGSGSRVGDRDTLGSGLERNRLGGGRFHRGCLLRGIFYSFKLFRRRRIEDTVGQRSERRLKRGQDLLPRASGLIAIERIDFGLDLRTEFVGSAAELVEEARNLASDLRHFLWAKENQHQKKQEDHLA